MFNNMFENIGKKIKTIAALETKIGIIVSIIIGLRLMNSSTELGILIIIGGSWLSWVSSIYVYGFGELIEKTSEIAHNTSKKGSADSFTSKMDKEQKLTTLLQWKESGLITEEEFNHKKRGLLNE